MAVLSAGKDSNKFYCSTALLEFGVLEFGHYNECVGFHLNFCDDGWYAYSFHRLICYLFFGLALCLSGDLIQYLAHI